MTNDMSDNDLISYALLLWANYIETGNVVMSAQDAQKAGESFNALTMEQMKLVVRLRELAGKELRR